MKLKLMNDFAEVRNERQKLLQVRADLASAESEIDGLTARHSEAVKAAHRVHTAAVAYLDGGSMEEVDLPALTQAMNDLRAKRAILMEAEEIQRARVTDAESRATQEICDGALPQYRQIMQRIANAIVELGESAKQERDFREALTADGVSVARLQVVSLPDFLLDNQYSRANLWLQELARDHNIRPRKR